MPNSTISSGSAGQSKLIVITPSPWFGKSAAIVAVYAPLPGGSSVNAPDRTTWPSSTIWYVATAPGQPSVTSASGSVQYAIGRPSSVAPMLVMVVPSGGAGGRSASWRSFVDAVPGAPSTTSPRAVP